MILGQFSHELNLDTSFLQKGADVFSSHPQRAEQQVTK